jgi:hypothetical protein
MIALVKKKKVLRIALVWPNLASTIKKLNVVIKPCPFRV